MHSVQDVLDEAKRCHAQGNLPRAEELLCKVISYAEDHPEPYFHLGTIYAQTSNHGRAITFLKKTLELEPRSNGAMMNLASVYRQIENREQSKYWIEQALAIERTPFVLSNMAGLYVNAGQPELAVRWADEALSLSPDLAQAGNHRALALLELGRWEEGWKQYDSRLDVPGFHRRPFASPMWEGQKVAKLAIHGEQGLGDEIMFMTLLRQVLPLVDECHIECAVRMVELFRHSFRNEPKVRFYGTYEELAAAVTVDAWIPMGSLPRIFGSWHKDQYLCASKKYGRGAWPRLGISWRGGSVLTHERIRNAPIEAWKPLIQAARSNGIEVISVQYGNADEVAQALEVPHDAAGIADMDVLTAMIQSCDLLISVCNTSVHQAGASNTPALQLVPSAPDWRCGLTGDKYRWYDSVDLMRQKDGEEWESVLLRATDYLNNWAAKLPARLVE